MKSARLTAFLSILLLTGLTVCSDPKPAQPPPAPPPTAPTAQSPPPAHLIIEGSGVAGITLGMTGGEVRARLGEPVTENRQGDRVVYMSYHPKDIFGVYLDPSITVA